ncbi:hypothetical protein ACFY05_04150 [Microtetraspora fusca]|uniref:DUF2510 domain-containing protein n=1 Tax=Microtetraspora fusca TaxID=1997 RepID=A0ABW6V1V0_MICFU
MRRFPAVVAIVGLAVAFGFAVIYTLVLLFPSSEQVEIRTAPTLATSTPQSVDEEEPEEIRLQPGGALPLKIDRETRDQLSAAARAVVDPSGPARRAVDVATSGTIWYGEVYGETPDTDAYYVVASIDRMYFWTQMGTGPWKYQGDFDARVCEPTVPAALNRAWGTGFYGCDRRSTPESAPRTP